jgi:hypothetical protein
VCLYVLNYFGGISIITLSLLRGRGKKATLPLRGHDNLHAVSRCMEPTVRVDAVEKRRNFHCRESNLGRPARGASLCRMTYSETNMDDLITSSLAR